MMFTYCCKCSLIGREICIGSYLTYEKKCKFLDKKGRLTLHVKRIRISKDEKMSHSIKHYLVLYIEREKYTIDLLNSISDYSVLSNGLTNLRIDSPLNGND